MRRGRDRALLARSVLHSRRGSQIRTVPVETRRAGPRLLRHDDRLALPAQFAHADERGLRARPAFGLLRAPRRRLHRRNFRRRKIRRHDPQVRRRHGLLLFPSAAQELPRGHDRRRGLRPGVLPAHLQHRHRADQAGRHPARREHGHPAHRSPGHPRIHPGQRAGRRIQQLQPLRRHYRSLHAGRGTGSGLRPRQPRQRQGAGAPQRPRSVQPAGGQGVAKRRSRHHLP